VTSFTGYLELGLRQGLHLREVVLYEAEDACRICYISDIHLRPGRSQLLSSQVLETCRRSAPHRILLGGDLLDKPCQLDALFALGQALSALAPTYAVAGNHDVAVGLDKVTACLESAGCTWIHSQAAYWNHQGRTISVAGPEFHGAPSADVRILCGHNPRIWKVARNCEFNLVLAGHLHGCQLVAFQFRNRLYPGAWFYPFCYYELDENGRKLVVSRGVADLVPIRFNCPREILLCKV
jgi:uncharacterized protein